MITILIGFANLEYCFLCVRREQILFPLQLTEKLGEVDIEAKVKLGGCMSQAGAIRYAISVALQSFVNMEMVEKMRLCMHPGILNLFSLVCLQIYSLVGEFLSIRLCCEMCLFTKFT